MEVKKRNVKSRGNGQGSVYKLPNGKWRAAVTLGYDENKRIYKTKSGFLRKKDALDYLSTLKEQTTDNTAKFSEIYDLWKESHFKRVSKDTENGYTNAYRHCKDLHYRVFSALKAADLQAVVDACPHGRRVKADMKSLLSNMYRYALENDLVDKNYSAFVKLPPKEKTRNDAFTAAELELLKADYEAGNKIAGYMLIMCYTGMRYGEISIMQTENIHLDERYMIGGIKSDAGRNRTIPIKDILVPIIKDLCGEKKLLEIPQKSFYTLYYATLEKLGIRKLSPHCCRHTAATMAAEAGIPPAIITAALGHSDYSTTLNYTHIPLEEMLKQFDKLK